MNLEACGRPTSPAGCFYSTELLFREDITEEQRDLMKFLGSASLMDSPHGVTKEELAKVGLAAEELPVLVAQGEVVEVTGVRFKLADSTLVV